MSYIWLTYVIYVKYKKTEKTIIIGTERVHYVTAPNKAASQM